MRFGAPPASALPAFVILPSSPPPRRDRPLLLRSFSVGLLLRLLRAPPRTYPLGPLPGARAASTTVAAGEFAAEPGRDAVPLGNPPAAAAALSSGDESSRSSERRALSFRSTEPGKRAREAQQRSTAPT